MILKEIKIRNYRPFRDISIDFAHGDQNITIIKGNSGTGKSALINAIYWCLYGYEILGEYEHLPICNIKATHLAGNGDEIEVSVELIFDDNGELLSFRRTELFYKYEGELIKIPDGKKFLVIKQTGEDLNVYEEDLLTVEKKIPRKIMAYYLLDVFNINFNRYDNKLMLDIISDFSQLTILKNVIQHLNIVKKYYISEIKKLSDDLGKNYERKKSIEGKIHETEIKINECMKINEVIDKEIYSLENKLKSIDSDISKIIQRKRELEDLIENNNLELEKLEEEHNKHVLTNYPYVLAYDILKLVDFGKKSKEKNLKFNELKEEIFKDVEEFKDISIDLHIKTNKSKNENENNIKELKMINDMITYSDSEEVRFLYEEYNSLTDHKRKIDMDFARFSHYIESFKNELQYVNNKIISLETNYSENNNFKKIKFCEESIKVAETIITQIKEELIKNIEVNVNEVFSKNPHKGQELEIIFNDNFEFIIKNKYGFLLNFEELSYAEQSCLALSFIVTLNKVYGINFPIIIDFLNIFDTDSKIQMPNYLIDLSQSNQIILLYTMMEDEFIDIISIASKNYELNFEMSDDGPESKVVLNE